jgi:hypothetical protein
MAKVHWTGRGRSFRSSPQRKALMAAGLLLSILGAILFSVAPSAGADTEQTVGPITSYADYPQDGIFPSGCTTDGPGILTGITYSVTRNGATQNLASLDSFTFQVGDIVNMRWTGYAPNCDGVGISLAVKRTDHPTFVLTDNQTLVGYQYCSGADCDAGARNGLTLTIPAPRDACNFQLDAVIGPPLGNVGPNGSYYGSNLRSQYNNTFPNETPKAHPTDRNMLIGFSNGGRTDCQSPSASMVVTCTAVQGGPGAIVTITNPDTQFDASVDVKKNNNLVVGGDNVAVAKNGGTATVNVPLASGEQASIDVVDNIDNKSIPGWPKDVTGPTDCDHESTTTTTTTTSTSTTTTTLVTTTTNPCEETTTTVDNGSTTTTNPECETTTTTEEVLPSSTVATTTPDTVQGVQLARTGANSTAQMTTYAGLLLVIGGALMALANWPVPAAATNRSRGR